MEKVQNEALAQRLTEIYAQSRGGAKEGIEMLKKDWFFDAESQSFYLRVVGNDGKPTTFIHRIPVQ